MTVALDRRHDINQMIRRVCFFFSFDLLVASVLASLYLHESAAQVWREWLTLQSSPCPLVTDYFRLGSLPAAFLNAGICGTVCAFLTIMPGAKYRPNVWAGYFLVIAHCFYGLNLCNMTPLILGFALYCKVFHVRFRDNLERGMFITAFGPFVSELLFRYPFELHLPLFIGSVQINLISILSVALLSVGLGFAVPAMLPGAQKLHRDYNLYNGGLASGLLGMFIFSFMYNTMGHPAPAAQAAPNPVYDAHGSSYMLFCTLFYCFMFVACILYGWFLNDKTFRGYGALLKDSGYKTNFIRDYGIGITWINLGFYGLMMVGYFDLVILLTDGAGFTGATCGIILAAMTFSASGQHPANVWPILAGYALMSLFSGGLCTLAGRAVPWTLSTQSYMNGLAFATGLCPFAGIHGKGMGIVAGAIDAVICTATSVMHGGFMLYNGGLAAGITALTLLPLIDLYRTHEESYGRAKGK